MLPSSTWKRFVVILQCYDTFADINQFNVLKCQHDKQHLPCVSFKYFKSLSPNHDVCFVYYYFLVLHG